MKRWFWLGAGVALGSLIAWGFRTSRAGYESLDYVLLTKDGKYEVRRYPAFMVAGTWTEKSERSDNEEFGRLFRFIQGENQRQEKIPMTTPVLTSENGDASEMSFVVPRSVAVHGVPPPTAPNVLLRQVTAGQFAVLRFSGFRSEETQQIAEARLRERMAEENLKGSGEAVFAYYDPPWTPSFLRRNEVMIRVEESPEAAG